MLLGEMSMRKAIRRKSKRNKPGVFGFLGSASGSGAIAGAHNVCHVLCSSFASLMAVFGITISSTALMFLQDYAIYFWSMGLFFLAVSIYFYFIRAHGSKKLMIANAGILVAGIPFSQVQSFVVALWIAGGFMIMFSIFLHFRERIVIFRR